MLQYQHRHEVACVAEAVTCSQRHLGLVVDCLVPPAVVAELACGHDVGPVTEDLLHDDDGLILQYVAPRDYVGNVGAGEGHLALPSDEKKRIPY